MKHILYLLPVLFLFACQDKADSPDESPLASPSESTQAPELISGPNAAVPLSRFTYADSVRLIPEREDSPQGLYKVNTVIPHADNEELNYRIQTLIGTMIVGEEAGMRVTDLEQTVRTAIRTNLKAYADQEVDTTDLTDHPNWYAYSFEYNTEVLYNENGLLSLRVDEYSYTGGAHPNAAMLLNTFQVSPARSLELKHVFKEEGMPRLTKLINSRLLREGLFDPDKDVPPTENFVVTDQGFLFLYQPYEIGPYAAGAFEVEVAREEMEGLLKF